MKAIVDSDLCIGCELCADTCPEVFRMMEDGLSHAIVEPVPEEQYDCVREAVEICPVAAISITAG